MNRRNHIKVIKGVSLYTRDNSKSGIWYYYFLINGKQIRRSTSHCDLDEAKIEAIAAYKAAKTSPETFIVKPTSFETVARRWLKQFEHAKDYARKDLVIRRFLVPFFRDKAKVKDIAALRQQHINDYLLWRRNYYVDGPGAHTPEKFTYMRAGKVVKAKRATFGTPKNTTLNRENNVLRQIITFAREEGRIAATTILKVATQSDDGERRPEFSYEQVQTIRRVARQRVADAPKGRRTRERQQLAYYVGLLSWTGMRPAEALSLTWRDIDVTNRKIYLRRGKTDQRIIPMLFQELVCLLNEMRAARQSELENNGEEWNETEALFVHPDGRRINAFATSLANLIKACDFPKPEGAEDYSAYSFRHSLATELANQGMPDGLLVKLLGTSREMLDAHYDHSDANDALAWADRQRKSLPEPDGDTPRCNPGAGKPLVLVDPKSSDLRITLARA